MQDVVLYFTDNFLGQVYGFKNSKWCALGATRHVIITIICKRLRSFAPKRKLCRDNDSVST